MATVPLHSTESLTPRSRVDQADLIADYLAFLHETREQFKNEFVSKEAPDVAKIREPMEEHYVDDQGQPAMFQRFESALYDDARAMVTLWNCFDRHSPRQLRDYRRLTELEITGLTGDRHPRKVFDRSPFGLAALIAGTITIWMTILKTYTGEHLSELLALIRFNSIAGVMWVVGLFVVVWYILKTHRNNAQVAFLSSLARALDLYLDDQPSR